MRLHGAESLFRPGNVLKVINSFLSFLPQKGKRISVLSKLAGTAQQLSAGALLVNPHDGDEIARAFDQAIHMGHGEREMRMRKLRAIVRKHNVYRWYERFCSLASLDFESEPETLARKKTPLLVLPDVIPGQV